MFESYCLPNWNLIFSLKHILKIYHLIFYRSVIETINYDCIHKHIFSYSLFHFKVSIKSSNMALNQLNINSCGFNYCSVYSQRANSL